MADQVQTKPEEEKKEEKVEDKGLRIKSTPAFKLKDRPTRRFVFIKMKQQFGFIPETIIIEKVTNSNNTLIVRAVLTEEEIKSEDARLKFIEETKIREAKRLKVDDKKDNGESKPSTSETK